MCNYYDDIITPHAMTYLCLHWLVVAFWIDMLLICVQFYHSLALCTFKITSGGCVFPSIMIALTWSLQLSSRWGPSVKRCRAVFICTWRWTTLCTGTYVSDWMDCTSFQPAPLLVLCSEPLWKSVSFLPEGGAIYKCYLVQPQICVSTYHLRCRQNHKTLLTSTILPQMR